MYIHIYIYLYIYIYIYIYTYIYIEPGGRGPALKNQVQIGGGSSEGVNLDLVLQGRASSSRFLFRDSILGVVLQGGSSSSRFLIREHSK